MNEQLTPEKILQTGLAFWASKTLLSAVEMGLFTELSGGPESCDRLSGVLACIHVRHATSSIRWWRWGSCERDGRRLLEHS